MPVPDEWDCVGSDEPVCPYCGAEQSDFFNDVAQGEGDGYTECGSCNRKFSWSCHVSVDFSTHPIVGPHQLDEFFQKEDAEENP
jgi:hypothetical protein